MHKSPHVSLPGAPQPRTATKDLHGFTVLDAFGLRIGSVCPLLVDWDLDEPHFCVQINVPGKGRRKHLLPISFITNVNPRSRFVQLSRLDRAASISRFPDVTDGSSAPFEPGLV